MLKPIPRQVLTHTVTLQEPTSDAYGAVSYTETELSVVHIQHSNAIVKTRDNREVKLSAILFFDEQLSKPKSFNLLDKQIDAESQNAQLKIVYGRQTFTVIYVETVPDDKGDIHHYEVGLV